MAQTILKLTGSESVTVLESSAASLEAEARYAPAGRPPPPHWHPSQDEHFEVLEGELRVRAGGEERTLQAGEELEVPRGTRHQMWNVAPAQARVRWRTTPPGRTEQWWRELDALQRSGRVSSSGMPSPLAMAVLITAYDDVFRLSGPRPLVRAAMAGLAVIGRARGYRPQA